MQKQKWNADRVQEVQKYMRDNKVTLETASKQLKFGMVSYYKYKKQLSKQTQLKKVQLNVEPYYNILPSMNKGKIVILVADVSQVKNLINEML